MIDFTQKYDRKEWKNFLKDRFLPDDFHAEEKRIPYTQKYTQEVTKLGECSSLNLSVFEIKHQSQNDARVGLSKETFALVREYTVHNRALALFVPQNNNERYRFSFIEFTPVATEQGKVKQEYSNPRRYSYLLGKDCKRHTPEDMLVTKGKVGTIEDLSSRFAIDVVTKKFYQELFDWYDKWAVNVVKFPVGEGSATSIPKKPDPAVNRQHLIRLIIRLIFVWFLKQKDHLIPEWIFDKDEVAETLKTFAPHSNKKGNYYNGIIQNLFFATLNKAVEKRAFAKEGAAHYGIKTYYRDHKDKSLFNISHEALIKKFETIPFLNGGLFECLDKRDEREPQQYHDGFSQESSRAAFVPNCLFFGNDEHEGIIELFSRYNFTVEENTPQDIDIALDPELLGKVFENLLGTFNEETNSTARKESGSFYTPREIVEYMVDASLKEYFKEKLSIDENGGSNRDALIEELFSYHAEGHHFNETQIACLIDAINDCKILDPACGSGAFPMGILHKLTFILGKLDPENKGWKEKQLEKADSLDDPAIREKAKEDIEKAFKNNELGYGRKLYLIEHCIYGVDIQPIAIQISKLRFFISLIVDQKTGGTKEDNYHVLPLPNLETKFVAANTLIGVKREEGGLTDPDIEKLQNKLLVIRHKHFSARNAKEKMDLCKEDAKLSQELLDLLKKDGFYNSTDAAQMVAWNPYNQNASSSFFDPSWMFGIKGGFDVVIGNPPYVKTEHLSEKIKTELQQFFGYMNDLYVYFIFTGYNLVRKNGILSFITNNGFLGFKNSITVRKLFFDNNLQKIIKCPAETFGADIYTAIFLLQKSASSSYKYKTYQFITKEKGKFELVYNGAVSYDLSQFLVHNRLVIYNDFSKIMLKMIGLQKMSDICSVLDTGIHTGNCREKLLFKEKIKNDLYKVLQGKQIARYFFDWDSPQARFKWADIHYKTTDTFGTGRGGKPSKKKEYWHFCGDEKNHLVDEKILLRQTDDDLIACYVNKEKDGLYYTDNTLHTVLAKDGYHIKYILALLNSKLLNTIYHFISQEEGKAMAQVKIQVVDSIPTHKINSQQQKPFIELVDKILAAKAAGTKADTRALERQVDDMVYSLYGLTGDEIKIVEGRK